MNFKNKNAAVAVKPADDRFKQKLAELNVNYERQFKNIIPGFVIAQPFVQDREIYSVIEEIQQNLSFNSFAIKIDLAVRKSDYKVEIGAMADEVRKKLSKLNMI